MPADPIHLNVRDVALAAKKAFEEGRLSAQGPTPAPDYRDRSGLPCAIGAALPDEWCREHEGEISWRSAHGLSAGCLVVFDDLAAATALQGAHDLWAHTRRDGDGADRVAAAETAFLAVLNDILGEAQ